MNATIDPTTETTTNATTETTTDTTGLSQERRDWLEALHTQRQFLTTTTHGMSDEQANTRSTVSELTLGGLIKHVTQVEAQWARFAVEGADAFAGQPWVGLDWEGFAALSAQAASEATADYESGFAMLPGETLTQLLAEYEAVAARTDELVTALDLDRVHPLPVAPWNPPDSAWSIRRTFAHIVAETAQHSGHADIIREAIDGAKTMG